MRTLILTNGVPPPSEFTRNSAKMQQVIIAADGAAIWAAKHGIHAHLICGDFDSSDPEKLRALHPEAEIIPLKDQNTGDLEKAVTLAIARGATSITILGGTGGRLDHLLANIAVLVKFHVDVPIVFEDPPLSALALSNNLPPLKLETKAGATISLIALTSETFVSTKGLKWELENQKLQLGTHGLSNVALTNEIVIHVHQGILVAMHPSPSLQR